jgi:hypothetical protein
MDHHAVCREYVSDEFRMARSRDHGFVRLGSRAAQSGRLSSAEDAWFEGRLDGAPGPESGGPVLRALTIGARTRILASLRPSDTGKAEDRLIHAGFSDKELFHVVEGSKITRAERTRRSMNAP